ncbi:MAG: hypothetical protein P8L45_09305 [Longimicrobiales bacterium]|nr:hypothetical protein [Longimicrobiales bacterium]
MTLRAAPIVLLLATVACTGADEHAAMMDMNMSAPGTDELAAYRPSAQQAAEVEATLQSLFDALETGDEDLLRSVTDPSLVMHFSETRDGETSFGSSTLDGLASRITSSETPLIERMWDPVVMVNGSLATIWTPYDFYVGETFSHCGVDAANLMSGPDGWRIVALSWTRLQPPECDLHPDGPPSI